MTPGAKTPLILAAILLLTVIGGVLYLSVDSVAPDGDPQTSSPTVASADSSRESFVDTPPPPRPAPAPPPISTLPKQERPGAEARRIIAEIRSGARAADLDAVFREANGFRDSGQETDAHLLYFYAAKNGHPDAMFILGAAYDPLHFAAASNAMDEPIPDQAHKWYRLAAGAGVEAADARLDALRSWVARAAANGDRDARQLLERW